MTSTSDSHEVKFSHITTLVPGYWTTHILFSIDCPWSPRLVLFKSERSSPVLTSESVDGGISVTIIDQYSNVTLRQHFLIKWHQVLLVRDISETDSVVAWEHESIFGNMQGHGFHVFVLKPFEKSSWGTAWVIIETVLPTSVCAIITMKFFNDILLWWAVPSTVLMCLVAWWEKVILIPTIIIKSILEKSTLHFINISKKILAVLSVVIHFGWWVAFKLIIITSCNDALVKILWDHIVTSLELEVIPRSWSGQTVKAAQDVCADTSVTDSKSF